MKKSENVYFQQRRGLSFLLCSMSDQSNYFYFVVYSDSADRAESLSAETDLAFIFF
jgi:hypothetical protein